MTAGSERLLLAGRAALVTGATGGLGASIVLALARAGCRAVAVGYGQNGARAEEIAHAASAIGAVGSLPIPIDVQSSQGVKLAVAQVLQALGSIELLVCAAGININGMSWKLEDDAWSDVLDVNLSGIHRVTRAVLPSMREARFGRILYLSSVVGQIGVPGTAAYAAAKAGIFGYTRTVASEIVASNVTVNALALGYFDAGLLHAMTDDLRSQIRTRIPVGRFGEPEKLGKIIAFLLSDDADYITGQVININGGLFS